MFDQETADKRKREGVIIIAPTVKFREKKILIAKTSGELFSIRNVIPDEIPSISLMAINSLKNIVGKIQVLDARCIHSFGGHTFLVEIMLPIESLEHFIKNQGYLPITKDGFHNVYIGNDLKFIEESRIFG